MDMNPEIERPDRRKVRTRALLREALLRLIVERGYDALTVQDITEAADIRRATFYMHYNDKEDLLVKVLQGIFDTLVQQIESQTVQDHLGGKTQPESFRMMFAHVAEHAVLYRVILSGQGGASVAAAIREYLANHVVQALHGSGRQTVIPAEVLARYIAGAELGFITWWLEAGMPYSPERMAEMAQALILHGVLPLSG
jgi:AcrR family transcriptional regulator